MPMNVDQPDTVGDTSGQAAPSRKKTRPVINTSKKTSGKPKNATIDRKQPMDVQVENPPMAEGEVDTPQRAEKVEKPQTMDTERVSTNRTASSNAQGSLIKSQTRRICKYVFEYSR